MVYTETTIQKIIYSKEDIISWAKTFASRQFGVNPESIKDEDIIIPEIMTIEVCCTKENTNQKDDK